LSLNSAQITVNNGAGIVDDFGPVVEPPKPRKRRPIQEELYDRYIRLEIMLKNPLVPVKDNAVAFLPYQIGTEGLYSEYLKASEKTDKAITQALMTCDFPANRQRHRVFRRSHSFDDFISLQRQAAQKSGDGQGPLNQPTGAGLVSLDAMQGKPSGDQVVLEGPIEGPPSGSTPSSHSGSVDVVESKGGMAKFTQFFKKLAGPTTNSTVPVPQPPPSGPKIGSSSLTPIPSASPVTTPNTISPVKEATKPLPSDSRSQTPIPSTVIDYNNLNRGDGRRDAVSTITAEEVERMVNQAFWSVKDEEKKERLEEMQVIREALDRLRQQQKIISRLLQEAVNAR